MQGNYRAQLQRIRTFPQLLRFLHDEMDWPIGTADFEEMTFEYSAQELGIDAKSAAKIEEIKRLRPLSVNQPWGIFFIKFEPKRLPVVALRRILSQVALKKRASANKAERTAWAVNDLLFISNYGEGSERQITFAHFSEDATRQSLPTLKVLGWDNLDTLLHLDDVADHLVRDLAWPDDDRNVESWRAAWAAAFTVRHREVITTSRELSIRLAVLARAIRDRIQTALAIETKNGRLTKLMAAFREALVHDLDEPGFADMYAQTIAYGLLSARVANPKTDRAHDAALAMPMTNPFLKELMETFLYTGGRRTKTDGPAIDFDELGVGEVVELLDDANMEAVIRDFGDRNPNEDPVIHFYEDFLAAYDKKQKVSRGVFYTPRPVVAFIVRSVDEMLRTKFGLEDGLADTTTWREMAKLHKELQIPTGVNPDQAFVQILDPATGTGTFLVEVIDVIHKTLTARWKSDGCDERKIQTLWNDYVPEHLLPRLYGYELLMAPYAIAHLKTGLKLYETGYRFRSNQRARIYLTNSLEPPYDFTGKFEFAIPALAHEAEAVSKIKRDRRFTVVVGNPPYSRASANKGNFATALIKSYKQAVQEEKNIQPLSDDYIKFIALAQRLLSQSGLGISGMITNNTYLSGRIHRGMREQLLMDNAVVHVVNLHGSGYVDFLGSRGVGDQNVFDILQGVAISLVSKGPFDKAVQYSELVGERKYKYDALSAARGVSSVSIVPTAPYFLLVPWAGDLTPEFSEYPSLTAIFRFCSVSGKPGDDDLLVSFSPEEVIAKLREFKRSEAIASGHKLTEAGRKFADLPSNRPLRDSAVVPYSYRPFDTRFTYYDPAIWTRAVPKLKSCVDGTPILLTTKIVKDSVFAHVFVSRTFADVIFLSNTSSVNCYSFPQRVPRGLGAFGAGISPMTSNLDIAVFRERLGREPPDGDVFAYVYAVLNSPEYRRRFRLALQLDFPRIPVTENRRLFEELVRLGKELLSLHLMESSKLGHKGCTYTGRRNPVVGRVGWSDGSVWLDVIAGASGNGFGGVDEAVWKFRVGGYRVCEKWLKDRRGRTLSKADIKHYGRIVAGVRETGRVMVQIDQLIEQHGGWPEAFRAGRS